MLTTFPYMVAFIYQEEFKSLTTANSAIPSGLAHSEPSSNL